MPDSRPASVPLDAMQPQALGPDEVLRAKLIAIYFPQFHAIEENDRWWGEGFTDWDNVRSGQGQYPGHYQPRVPLGGNYYDQSRLETLRWQVDLAKRHGIFGFCHYHYWFDGQQLLETPTELMLANQDIDFPFCLSWANETWSRRWDGRDHHVLMLQTHPPNQTRWRAHFDYLIRAWTDPRAIRVDGRPVFIIYRPQNIEKIEEMLAFWRTLALQHGLPGLYFIFQQSYALPQKSLRDAFDARFLFQPFETVNSPGFDKDSIRHSRLFQLVRRLPEKYQDWLRGFRAKFINELTLYNYDAVWRWLQTAEPPTDLTTFPGAFVDWDNSSRYKRRATIFQGATPERFGYWLGRLIDSLPQRNLPENLVFLNAWNEWSESAYLEPDEKYGFQYLQAVLAALRPRAA